MINKTPAKKTDEQHLQRLLVVSSVILTALLGYASIRSFLYYHQESSELRQLEALHSRLESDYVGLEKLLLRYTHEQEKFQELLFKEQDIPLFLEEISRFAADAKVKIIDVKTRTFAKVKYSDPMKAEEKKKSGPGQEGAVLSSLPVQVSIRGSFKSVVKFLIQLEKYKQLLTLSDVDIRVKEYPQLSCSLIVNIYSLREMQKE